MSDIYQQQLNDMLRYANQCAAALGSKYRYKAARRRPHSACASQRRVAGSMEGYVEKHRVSVCTVRPDFLLSGFFVLKDL
jgi:hypothetical protein